MSRGWRGSNRGEELHQQQNYNGSHHPVALCDRRRSATAVAVRHIPSSSEEGSFPIFPNCTTETSLSVETNAFFQSNVVCLALAGSEPFEQACISQQFFSGPMMRPGRADNILFDHDAAQIVGAEVEALPTHIDALGQPGHLNVWNIVEIQARHAQPAQILLSRTAVWNFPAYLGVVWLQRPGDEGNESARLLLQLIELIQVFNTMLQCFAQPEHHGCRGRQPQAGGQSP